MSSFASSCARVLGIVMLLALPVQMVSGAEGQAAGANTTTNHTSGQDKILAAGESQEVATPTHVFRFYRDARVEVAIRDGEGFIGKPIAVTFGSGYADANKVWHARPIKEYVTEPEWDVKSQSVLHQLVLEDNVKVDVYYQVKSGVLYVGLSIKEPPSISFPGSYTVGFSQFDVVTYDTAADVYKGWPAPEGVAPPKLPAVVKGMQISVKCKNMAKVVYPYAKGIPHFVIGEIDEVAITGVYGKRVVSLYPAASNGFLSSYIYGGNAPCQGYSFGFHKQEPRHSATSSSELMRLTVK